MGSRPTTSLAEQIASSLAQVSPSPNLSDSLRLVPFRPRAPAFPRALPPAVAPASCRRSPDLDARPPARPASCFPAGLSQHYAGAGAADSRGFPTGQARRAAAGACVVGNHSKPSAPALAAFRASTRADAPTVQLQQLAAQLDCTIVITLNRPVLYSCIP